MSGILGTELDLYIVSFTNRMEQKQKDQLIAMFCVFPMMAFFVVRVIFVSFSGLMLGAHPPFILVPIG